MNRTRIEWADMTWNPLTGCLHGCEYCYARKIARRFSGYGFLGEIVVERPAVELNKPAIKTILDKKVAAPYPFDFQPTFHRYRLEEPQKIKKPQNVFVCSMADLFGDWVPDEWIQAVFEACEKAPQHRYMFLTKNPNRYELYHNKYADKQTGHSPLRNNNFWFGHTKTGNFSDRGNQHTRFVSIEPLQEELNLTGLRYYEWIIVGAETGNRKGKIIPERDWIEYIVHVCKKNNVPLFMKDSLAGIWQGELAREFPWEAKQ